MADPTDIPEGTPDSNNVDRRYIDLSDPAERAYWCKFFDVPLQTLAAAVGAVGSSAHKVREYLTSHR